MRQCCAWPRAQRLPSALESGYLHPIHSCSSQGARTMGHVCTGVCILRELLSSAGRGKSQGTVCWYKIMGMSRHGLSVFLQGCEELMCIFLCPVFARTPGPQCSSHPELLVCLRPDSSPLKLQAERGSDCAVMSLSSYSHPRASCTTNHICPPVQPEST